jgi:hypothetical protein
MEEKMIRYIAMKLQLWPNMRAITPNDQPVGGCGRSSGCLLVYDSVDDLLADHPGCEYKAIEEKTNTKTKGKP